MAVDLLIILSSSAHVFTAIIAMLAATMMFGEALWGGSAKRMRTYGIVLLIFIALTYVLAGWWYVIYYGADKAIIIAGEMAWAHTIVMETKEHIFVSGFWLLIVLSLFGIYSTDDMMQNENFKRTMALLAITGILGVIVLEAMGGIIVAGLKVGLLGGGA